MTNTRDLAAHAADALRGGGEMGALIREFDWATTAVGAVTTWPQSLRTAISILLSSRFPMIIFWGPDLVQFYNDAYRPILGATKHPAALGQRAEDCWPEIWEVVGPMLAGVLATAEATWSDDQLLLLDRYGFAEECYFTFSYSPIRDETGGIGGVFCAVTETTGRVVGERRLRMLHELAAQMVEAHTPADVCARAAQALAGDAADLPLAVLYLLDGDGLHLHLGSATGVESGGPISPASVVIGPDGDVPACWPFGTVAHTGQPALVEDLAVTVESLAVDGQLLRSAIVLPLTKSGQERPLGFLVAGLSPRLSFDEAYRGFCRLLAGQIAAAIGDARAFEAEHRRTEALQAITDTALAHLGVQDLLQELLARVADALVVDNVAILLPADDGNLVLHMVRGPEEAVAEQVRVPIGHGVAGTIAASRQPRIIDDLRTGDVVNPFLKEALHSLMGVPLVVEDRLIGVLHVATVAPRHFTEDDLALLRLVADRIALALDHARLYAEEQQLRTKAEDAATLAQRLHMVAAALARAVTPQEVVSAILDQGLAALGVSQGSVALLSEDGTRLDMAGATGPASVLVDQWQQFSLGTPLPLAETVRTGEIIVLGSRSEAEERYPLMKDASPAFQFWVAFPLLAGGRAIGGVGVSAAEPRAVTETGRQLLLTLARQCGQAMERARLYDTERRTAAALRARTNELETLLRVLPIGIGIAGDAAATDIRVNPALARMLGIPPEVNASLSAQEAERPTNFRVHRDGREMAAGELPMQVAAAQGVEVRDLEVELARDDGVRLILLEYAAPLFDDVGQVRGAVGAFLDITERAMAERERDTFLASMTHDLKNPLTAISGHTQLGRRRLARLNAPEAASASENLAHIEASTASMLGLINELLDLARLQAGSTLDLLRTPANLLALLRDVVSRYQVTSTRAIEIETDLADLVLEVDTHRIERVLANLLSNAVKYSEEGAGIVVRLAESYDDAGRNWAVVSVEDTGLGIPAADLPHIFDRFRRGTNVAGRIGGTGIGLASARQIIELHGGTIAVASREGAGTTVTVRLPLDASEPGAAATT